jgi:hypothetical protein
VGSGSQTSRPSPAPLEIAVQQWNGGGATVDVALGRGMSIDASAMWNRKGATLTIVANSAFQDVHADYLSVPVLFKAATTSSNSRTASSRSWLSRLRVASLREDRAPSRHRLRAAPRVQWAS